MNVAGTFSFFRAVYICSPCSIGTRRSASPCTNSVGVVTPAACITGDHLSSVAAPLASHGVPPNSLSLVRGMSAVP